LHAIAPTLTRTQVAVLINHQVRAHLEQQHASAEALAGHALPALAMLRGGFARVVVARRTRVNGDNGAPAYVLLDDVTLRLSMRLGYACLLTFDANSPAECVMCCDVMDV
jgi:hypothetical protein